MTVSEWFGKQDLGLKYAIVLGSLIIITVVCAVCKLIYTKLRVKSFEKEAETAQLERGEEQHNLNEKREDEGDLFGLRALEKGFFGGVAQSRPVSIDSLALLPPRSAHFFGRPSSELGNQRYALRAHSNAYRCLPIRSQPFSVTNHNHKFTN
ncbi:hypothetical protein EV426DRAFT_299579 [Tirmania nivea]|nr:hypothetical protein EV426DRAFT_299579 [Tirmania nivea]